MVELQGSRRLVGALLVSFMLGPSPVRAEGWLGPAARALLQVSTMGVEIEITAVDVRFYRERFVPSYRAAERGKDFRPFTELLRRGLVVAPEHRYEPRFKSPWDDPEIARKRIEADAAEQRGDGRPWRELIALVAAKVRGPPAPALTKREIGDALETLESKAASVEEKTRIARDIGPSLIGLLCVPWTRVHDPSFNLTRSELTDELTRRSETLDHMLFGIGLTGGLLEISSAESAHVMSRADLERVIAELARIPRPEGSQLLAQQYDQLREIVEFASSNPDFALVVMSR